MILRCITSITLIVESINICFCYFFDKYHLLMRLERSMLTGHHHTDILAAIPRSMAVLSQRITQV